MEITMSYYPDSKQERLLMEIDAPKYVDLMHSMAYDQGGQHSTMELARRTIEYAELHGDSFKTKMTLGVPFYGRHMRTGEWKSYEDIVSKMDIKSPDQDEIDGYYFNGPTTIRNKVKLAKSSGLAGVMVWETGQDCRVNAVTWGMPIVFNINLTSIKSLTVCVFIFSSYYLLNFASYLVKQHAGDTTHDVTCPNGASSSLLRAIGVEITRSAEKNDL